MVLLNLKLFEPKHTICTHNIKINYLVQSDLFVNGSKMKNCDNVRTTCANIYTYNQTLNIVVTVSLAMVIVPRETKTYRYC